jgi:hypothetical protein
MSDLEKRVPRKKDKAFAALAASVIYVLRPPNAKPHAGGRAIPRAGRAVSAATSRRAFPPFATLCAYRGRGTDGRITPAVWNLHK